MMEGGEKREEEREKENEEQLHYFGSKIIEFILTCLFLIKWM